MRSPTFFACLWALSTFSLFGPNISATESAPNILFCISDDQSYAHTGANGDLLVKTPAFDQIAREGIRFTHAFCDAPTCGPSRSAILTGQPIWRLEEAGNIHSTLPAKFATYTQILENAGYAIGSTSKAWGPAGLKPPAMMTTHSLKPVFASTETKPRTSAFIAMERHDGCRKGGKGYPCRAIRTADFLYILNHQPDRWPAGDPDASACARTIPFGEVDGSPTKQLLMDNADKSGFRRFYELAFAKRPGEELYDLKRDPGQLRNLATRPEFAQSRKRLRGELRQYLTKTKDPRALGLYAPCDYYPYYGLRRNKDWKVDARH